jgi:hypothetical protein
VFEDGIRPRYPVELGEELAFRLQLLDDRLDHEVAVREVGEVCCQRQARERCVALVLRQAPLLHPAREVALDRRASPLGEGRLDLAPNGVMPRDDRNLRDARAHRSQPDDSYSHAHDPMRRGDSRTIRHALVTLV